MESIVMKQKKNICIFECIFWTTTHYITKFDLLIYISKGKNIYEFFEQFGGLELNSRSFSI